MFFCFVLFLHNSSLQVFMYWHCYLGPVALTVRQSYPMHIYYMNLLGNCCFHHPSCFCSSSSFFLLSLLLSWCMMQKAECHPRKRHQVDYKKKKKKTPSNVKVFLLLFLYIRIISDNKIHLLVPALKKHMQNCCTSMLRKH